MTEKKTISQRFEIRLAVIVAISLTAATLVVFALNTGINKRNYSDTIFSTLTDIEKDIEDTSDINMLTETLWIRVKVKDLLKTIPLDDTHAFNDALRRIVEQEELSEISIANLDNVIIYSSVDEYVNFDMNSTEATKAFDVLNHGATQIVQPVRENAYHGEGEYALYNKYAGAPLDGIGYLQVAISSQQFQKQIDQKFEYIAANRHIGQSGVVFISNGEDKIISCAGLDESTYKNVSLSSIGIDLNAQGNLENTFTCEINGVKHLVGARFVEGYNIIGAVPMSEVQSFRNRAAAMSIITEIIVFALMFFFIQKMINSIIVSKIHNVNRSLQQIIEGNLDTKVCEYSTVEFAHLSDDINSTVDSLKDYMEREKEQVKKELSFAKTIQASALPKLHALDNYRATFDLSASMYTAKAVGGDFYDFYMVDDSHLAFLVADVSGKGIPAAMFMMTSKTMLKNLVESGMSLNDAFNKANEDLCTSNDADMFVTVWMGILDLKTGFLEYINAGHNPPLVYDESGHFSYLKGKHDFVLTGMDGVEYHTQAMTLKPGDKIFLYTDGVTEATDTDNQLFGEERLLSYIDGAEAASMNELLIGVKSSIDAFVREAEQFDDITMLGLHYKGWSETR